MANSTIPGNLVNQGGGGSGGSVADTNQQTFTATAAQTIFPLSPTVNIEATLIFLNGVKLLAADYTLTTSQLTLGTGAALNDEVCVVDWITDGVISSGSGATEFTGLTDTPASFSGHGNKVAIVNSGETALEFIATSSFGGAGSTIFTALTDTPSTYSGQGDKGVKVNAGETALEFYTITSGSGGSGDSTTETITYTNSFTALDVIYRSGSGYFESQADQASTSEVLGVIESRTGTTMDVVYSGKLNATSHGLGSNGDILYLDSGSAGTMINVEPATGVSKPVGVVIDANTLVIIPHRGALVDGSGVSWTFPESNFEGDGVTTAYDHNALIGAESSILVTLDGLDQPVTSFNVGNDGSGDRTRVTFTEAPYSGSNISIHSLGVPYNTPVATGTEPWTLITSNTSGSAGGYVMLGSGSAYTLSLPASPSDNDFVYVSQGDGDLSVTNVTVDGGAKNISDNISADSTTDILNTNFAGRIVYTFKSTLDKWKVT